jgi:hypothetical protein
MEFVSSLSLTVIYHDKVNSILQKACLQNYSSLALLDVHTPQIQDSYSELFTLQKTYYLVINNYYVYSVKCERINTSCN